MSIAASNYCINLLSLIGLLIAAYSYKVKQSFLKNPTQYRAVCDVSNSISCTRVITSQ